MQSQGLSHMSSLQWQDWSQDKGSIALHVHHFSHVPGGYVQGKLSWGGGLSSKSKK